MYRLVGIAAKDNGLGLLALAVVAFGLSLAICLLAWLLSVLPRTETRSSRLVILTGRMVLATWAVATGTVVIAALARGGLLSLSDPLMQFAAASVCGLLLIVPMACAATVLDRGQTQRLTAEVLRLQRLSDATSEGVILEQDGIITDVNRAVIHMSGVPPNVIIGRRVTELIARTGLSRSIDDVLLTRDGQSISVRVIRRDGAAGGHNVVLVRPAVPAAGRRLRADPLTGLANRDGFEQQLGQLLTLAEREASGVALLCIDLDRFERLNETLGPNGGEQLLTQVADRLTQAIGGGDTVARTGRDVFSVIQPLANQAEGAAALADRILTELSLPYTVDGQMLAAPVCIGVALYPADGADAPALIRSAALAVQQAKQHGRGRWSYFERGVDAAVRARLALELDLRSALNDGQFSLNYQPFVDTETLEITGYEALLRWDHPERGRIPPSDFIPLAESSGLVVPIGGWVLATACAEAASWDIPAVISVNLSPAQFVQPGIVDTVSQVLQQTGLPPQRLELEITEGTLMDDTSNAPRILTALQALGVKIAMDDFGTGYSSLSYLRRFPFDKIKIDRSFINDVENNREAATIVQAIVAMGRSLHLAVTAEGVETEQQLTMLRALGCDFVQGYLLGRPCTADQLDVRSGKKRWELADRALPVE